MALILRSTICIWIICFTLATSANEDQRKPWSPEVMFSTKLISDPQISPDKSEVLFVVFESNVKKDKVDPAFIIYKGFTKEKKDPIAFTSSEYSSSHPRWSPDGQWIAFLSNRSGVNKLYIICSEGGEASALTKENRDVLSFSWSPDGKKIAFVMEDKKGKGKNDRLVVEYKKERLGHRLWVIDPFSDAPKAEAITPREYSVTGAGDFGRSVCSFDWSPDSKYITFAHAPSSSLDDFHLDSSLATIELETGEVIEWQKQAEYESFPKYSHDGKFIAYIYGDSERKYAYNKQVALRSANGNFIRKLAPTFNEGSYLIGPALLGWSEDDSQILFFEPKSTQFHIERLPADGKAARELQSGNYLIGEPSLSSDGSHLVFVLQTSEAPPEVYFSTSNEINPIPVSSLNKELTLYSQLHTKRITWNSEDGLCVEGLLTYPVHYEPESRYPLLVVIHGGPMSFFDETFIGTPYPYPLAAFAESGFAILRPNPRGSCGYGKTFRCANYGDWGGGDYVDIMKGIDHLIDQGIADEKRLGVMGWSYGGYMSAWMISQTNRFKAASLGAGPYNLTSMTGTTDIHRLLTDYLGDYNTNQEIYISRSPINYVLNVKTPCLIQHGLEDKRVPVSQAYELYHALERAGNSAKLMLYPDMGHWLTNPKAKLHAMEMNLEWFKTSLSE